MANNPAMCAFTEAMKMGVPLVGRQFYTDEIAILSVGTGDVRKPILYSEASRWGLARWLAPPQRPLIDVVMGGASHAVNHELTALFRVCDASSSLNSLA